MRPSARFMFTVPVLALSLTGLAMASGGGGGGGGGYSPPPSASVPAYDPAVEYQTGLDALKNNDYRAAATAFRNVVSITPRDVTAQYYLGLSYFNLKDFKKAKKPFENVAKLNATLIDPQRDLALTYIYLGGKERPKADPILASLKDRLSKCDASCSSKTALEAAVAKIEAALAEPQKSAANRVTPQLASIAQGDAQYFQGLGLINEGRYDEAITSLNASLAQFGSHPDILTYLGFANRKLKHYDVAESYYRQALAIAPSHRGANQYYGELMVERGDLPGARKQLVRLEKICTFGCYEVAELQRWIEARAATDANGA